VNRNGERRAYRLARRALLLRAHLRIPAWYAYRYPFQPDKKLLTKSEKNVLSRCKKISLGTSASQELLGQKNRKFENAA